MVLLLFPHYFVIQLYSFSRAHLNQTVTLRGCIGWWKGSGPLDRSKGPFCFSLTNAPTMHFSSRSYEDSRIAPYHDMIFVADLLTLIGEIDRLVTPIARSTR